MVHIPPEIKALIVDEIWHSRDPEPSLSALGLVWKDATASIRSHRFNDVHVSPAGLPRLLAFRHDTTRPFTLIRKLTVDSNCQIEAVILNAINVEALTYSPGYSLDEISSLDTHTRLTSLTFSQGELGFSALMDLLHTIPRLTSLTLSHFCVSEFYRSAVREWPYEYREDHRDDMFENREDFSLGQCAPMQWEACEFPDSDPLPNISHLSLDISRAEHLWFLDFVCSPKSPFRDLQKLGLSDTTDSFMDARVDALLKKHSSSLVEFELREDGLENTDSTWIPENVLPPIRLTLPAGVQHFKFFVDIEDLELLIRPDIMYDNIKNSCDALGRVTMHIRLGEPRQIISEKNAELDRALASLDLQRFDVQVGIHREAGVEVGQQEEYARARVAQIFPLITEKFLEGGAGGTIFWAFKGSKGACA